MAFEYAQHERSSPPPAYADSTPGGMESEMYIDGTLYVNGVAVNRSDRKGRAARQIQRQQNPCETFLRWLRSEYSRAFALVERSLCLSALEQNFGPRNKRNESTVNSTRTNTFEQRFVNWWSTWSFSPFYRSVNKSSAQIHSCSEMNSSHSSGLRYGEHEHVHPYACPEQHHHRSETERYRHRQRRTCISGSRSDGRLLGGNSEDHAKWPIPAFFAF